MNRKKLLVLLVLLGGLLGAGNLSAVIKVVFTGGPCVGKTSLVKELRNRGHVIVSEGATYLIKKGEVHPVEHGVAAFQEAVLEEQIKREDRVNELSEKWEESRLIFFDRGMVDPLGYYYKANIEPPNKLLEAIKGYEYDVVFVLKPVRYTKVGSVRFENPEEAKIVHENILKAYKDNGYEVFLVPNFHDDSVEGVRQRVVFVLEQIIKRYSKLFQLSQDSDPIDLLFKIKNEGMCVGVE